MKKLFYLLCCMFVALLVGCETKEPTNSENPNNPSSGGGAGDANDHAYVDLGLSVKWATCNVGASSPEDYGDYFAWGDINTKGLYDCNYKWSTKEDCKMSEAICFVSKYCTNEVEGIVDNKTVLDLLDDVANVKFGGNWRMPTKEEWEELINNCTWIWKLKNGVKGYEIVGVNGNSIFLPAVGLYFCPELIGSGECGYYWTSSLFDLSSSCAFGLSFKSDLVQIYYYPRDMGMFIRPVLP